MLTKFCFIDTETTGLDCNKNGVIQIAGYIYYNNDGVFELKDTFNLIQRPFPNDLIEDTALEVNGKTRDEIKDYQNPQNSYTEFTSLLSTHCDKFDKQDKMFFTGYNARFDYDFMRAWFNKCGDKYFGSWFFFPPIDVMNQAIIKLIQLRHTLPNFKLKTVTEHFGIIPTGNLHDALTDIDITKQLFLKLIAI